MARMIIICMCISIILLIGTYILNRRATFGGVIDKRTTIESGFESIDSSLVKQHEYYLPFFLIGILFIIFDLEAVLLYPFANILVHYMYYHDHDNTTLLIYLIFVLFIYFIIYGLYFEYTKNVL